MTLAVDTAYIAAAANRHSNAADVFGSLVAFGSSTLVALWDAAVSDALFLLEHGMSHSASSVYLGCGR